MNLDSTNRWLTLAANIGVLAGILFLAYEIQQNTVATRLEAASNFNDSFSEIELFVAGNPEFAELLARGRDGGEVSGVDQLRLTVFYNNVLRQWQFTHFQYLSDAFDEDFWQANRAFMIEIVSGDIGLVNHWQNFRHQYSLSFNNMMKAMTEEVRQE